MSYSPETLAKMVGMDEPTDEQCDIITADLKPGITIAGAGSGKTSVISLRVLYLVANGLVEPQQIIGLTFTNKAAGEMSAKISKRLAKFRKATGQDTHSAEAPTIQTYNSYAAGLVREYGASIGVEPDTQVLDDASAVELADQIIASADPQFVPKGKSRATLVKDLIQLAGQANEHLRTADEIIEYVDSCLESFLNHAFVEDCAKALSRKRALDPDHKSELTEELKRIQESYAEAPARLWPSEIRDRFLDVVEDAGLCAEITDLRNKRRLAHLLNDFAALKKENRAMQFSDQVAFAYKAVTTDPGIIENERAKWKVIFLDEYQDTSDSQVRLLTALFAGLPITAVGDPRQSIYAWRGASELNIEGFPKDFSANGLTPDSFHMTVAFRNSQRVLSIANAIAQRLPEDSVDTRLKPIVLKDGTMKSPLGAVEVCIGQGKPHEKFVNDELENLVDWMREREGHRAVLVRKRAHFAPVAQALNAAGFDVQVVGDSGGMDDPYVADIFAILNVVSDPHAAEHLTRLLTGRICKLGAHDLRAFSSIVKNANQNDPVTPLTAVECVDSFADHPHPELSHVANVRLRNLARKLRDVRSSQGGVVQTVRTIIRVFDIAYELASLPFEQAHVHRTNIDSFVAAIYSYLARKPQASLTAVVAWLALAHDLDAIDSPPEALDDSAITIMTVHASKGLEFDAVALPFLTVGDLPTVPRSYRAWLTLGELPYPLRGDATKLPQLDLSKKPQTGIKSLAEKLAETDAKDIDIEDLVDSKSNEDSLHLKDQIALYHRRQERRLAYVAVTRAKEHLWMGASYWGYRTKVNTLSPFLLEAITALNANGANIEIPEPASDKPDKRAVRVQWPPVETEETRNKQARTRDFVGAQAPLDLHSDAHDGDEEFRKVVARVKKIMSDKQPKPTQLPQRLSTSDIVKLKADAKAFKRELQRPMPQEPSEYAALGTAFHAWVEHTYGQSALTDIHAAETRRALPPHLRGRFDSLVRTFEASAYVNRVPHAVELPFELEIGERKVPGKIDAVFKDGNTVTVVDWKTGKKPANDVLSDMTTQLAIYVQAVRTMPEYADCAISAEFYFVGSDETFRPDSLPTIEITDAMSGDS